MTAIAVIMVCVVLVCAVVAVVLVVKMIRSGRARDRALADYRSAVEGHRGDTRD